MPASLRDVALAVLLPVILLPVALLLPACRPVVTPAPPPSPWPAGQLTWQWQLTGRLDPDVDAQVFLLDGFDTAAAAAQLLRGRGRRLICHVMAGVHEPGRPDAARFPDTAIGAPVGSPTGAPSGARWLDIRRWEAIEPVLADRFRLCLGKGFHAVAPDGVQGYAAGSGFPLTFDDQLVFNRRVAALARSLGLSPGLRNDIEQATALEPDFDFAVNEECVRSRRCDRLVAFVDAGKPVFHVEYEARTADFCVTTLGYGFSSMRKARELGVWRAPCLP